MFVDLSHTVEHGMITYKGLPAPVISDFMSRENSRSHYEEGTEFNIAKIEMVANTGTYLDSPFHRYARGKDLSQLDLNLIADVPAIVVRCSDRVIGEEALDGLDIAGRAVLFHTGWDAHWRTETYWNGEHPFLTEGAANHLVESGAAIVGIDSYNIDSITDGRRPAHSILLGNDIAIVEHLRGLGELPDSGSRFFAVPVKVRQFGTFPVRAFAIVPKHG
ncbi:MAG TPA: cyclase family protein [Pyrinomonadaceae bacterium]|nr:cyclase family protein [Pyrinomonadaceae bacterium]